MKKIRINWTVDPDNCASRESVAAGKPQFMVEIHASFGPFDSYDEATEYGNNIVHQLPSYVKGR